VKNALSNWSALAIHGIRSIVRVCWPGWTEKYNCGRCEKCLRTMIALHIAGALGDAVTFQRSLILDNVRRMEVITGESSLRFLEDLVRTLGDSEEDRRIAAAPRHVMRWTHLRAQFGPFARRYLGPLTRLARLHPPPLLALRAAAPGTARRGAL
jgi:hypothetical protein